MPKPAGASPQRKSQTRNRRPAPDRHLLRQVGAYQRAFAANPLPLVVYDSDTLNVLRANQSARTLYGYTRLAVRHLHILDLFALGERDDRDELRSQLRARMGSVGPYTHRTGSGEALVVRVVLFSMELKGTECGVAMILDETDRHTVQEALRSSEERYRELFENANDVIFLHDLKGRVIAVNRAAEHLSGYSRIELVGKPFDELVAHDARYQIADSIRAHLGGSAAQHYELPIVSKANKARFLEVSTRVIYRRGAPIGIQGIGRDITERKLAQQKLLESSRQLQEKNEELSTALRLAREATQLKEQFLANTSHELRTPMNGIMGMINLLKSTDLSSDQREYADAVSQCANDLLTIINDLLDLSQIEAGRLSLADETYDMRESVIAVVKLLRVRAQARSLYLTYELSRDLPVFMQGDSVRFRQILTNLISNAIKFTPNGGVHVRLLTREPERLRCEVIDAGIGVDEAVRERIFEAFFQADGTPRRRYGGTGLGLTISKQLVEIFGGEIGTYNNASGPGATFWFEIPLRTGDPLSSANLVSSWVDLP